MPAAGSLTPKMQLGRPGRRHFPTLLVVLAVAFVCLAVPLGRATSHKFAKQVPANGLPATPPGQPVFPQPPQLQGIQLACLLEPLPRARLLLPALLQGAVWQPHVTVPLGAGESLPGRQAASTPPAPGQAALLDGGEEDAGGAAQQGGPEEAAAALGELLEQQQGVELGGGAGAREDDLGDPAAHPLPLPPPPQQQPSVVQAAGPCQRLLWFVAMGGRVAPDRLPYYRAALLSARRHAPSLVPVLIYSGEGGEFIDWVRANGAHVVNHTLSFLPLFEAVAAKDKHQSEKLVQAQVCAAALAGRAQVHCRAAPC